MTEQEYRVIADRDKGDDPKWLDVQRGDRYTAISDHTGLADEDDPLVRIERPVPTTDEPKQGVSTERLRDMADLLDGLLNRVTLRQAADELDRLRAATERPSPHPPTREQIAEVIKANFHAPDSSHSTWWIKPYAAADAVLALIQNGADR